MKFVTRLAAIMSALCVLTVVPAARAEGSCQFPVVVLAIAGPVTLVCGDGNNTTTNHTTTVTIDPSVQIDPHLLTPQAAPPPPPGD